MNQCPLCGLLLSAGGHAHVCAGKELADVDLAAIRDRDTQATIGNLSMPLAPMDSHFMTTTDRRHLLGHITYMETLCGRLRALNAEALEYRKHVQSHCEHDWTETLHGPDTVGEHCHICGVDREYDYGDEDG